MPAVPEWAPLVVALGVDILVAAGFVSAANVALARVSAMLVLYRELNLTVVAGYVLPRRVPLSGLFLLRLFVSSQWRAFRRYAKDRLDVPIAQMPDAPPRRNNYPKGKNLRTGGGVTTQHSSRPRTRTGENSGYDVSSVSGEEVVELSSWADNSRNSSTRRGPTARRRPF